MPSTKRQQRNSQFKQGQGVFTCHSCGHKTRDTGDNGGLDMCPICLAASYAENGHSDNGASAIYCGLELECPTCADMDFVEFCLAKRDGTLAAKLAAKAAPAAPKPAPWGAKDLLPTEQGFTDLLGVTGNLRDGVGLQVTQMGSVLLSGKRVARFDSQDEAHHSLRLLGFSLVVVRSHSTTWAVPVRAGVAR